jgi:hypothetical protein
LGWRPGFCKACAWASFFYSGEENQMKSTLNHVLAVLCALLIFTILSFNCEANDKVKYCKDAQTGRIIVIQAGYACPMGTYAI